MMKLIVFAAIAAVSAVWAEPDPNFHIYIAYGQSNMEGCGSPVEEDEIEHPRFKMFATQTCSRLNRDVIGDVYPAIPSLFKCGNGVSIADWFGRTLVDSLPDVTIGIVPVAVGGASIKLFDKDQYADYIPTEDQDFQRRVRLYAEDGNIPQLLVDLGKKAQELGVIKGFIFHQGETDGMNPDWLETVRKTRYDLLEALGLSADSVPFIAGQLLRSGIAYPGQVDRLPRVMRNAYVVSSEGLEGQDEYHFNRNAVVEFGKRYALKMLETMAPEEPTRIAVQRKNVGYPLKMGKGRAYDIIGRLVQPKAR